MRFMTMIACVTGLLAVAACDDKEMERAAVGGAVGTAVGEIAFDKPVEGAVAGAVLGAVSAN